MKKVILLSVVAAMAFVSCDVNDDITNNNEPQAVKFTSGINALPTTKAAIDGTGSSVWEAGDPVGIYMLENGTTTATASNMKYVAEAAGKITIFKPFSDATTLFYPTDEELKFDFIAYHPHNTAVADYVYPINVVTQTPQTNIDLMWAKANNSGDGYGKTDAATPVDFTFEHKLVKLILNVSKTAGVTGDLTAVSITGMNTTGTLDLSKINPTVTVIDSKAPITLHTVNAGSKYEAILLPATLDANSTVVFTVGGETYTWGDMSTKIPELKAGNIYTYTITVTKYAIEATGSIAKWTATTPGTGIAE